MAQKLHNLFNAAPNNKLEIKLSFPLPLLVSLSQSSYFLSPETVCDILSFWLILLKVKLGFSCDFYVIFIEFPPSITNLCARSFAAAAVVVPCRAGDAWPLPVGNPAKAAISNCWPCWYWNCLPLPPLLLPLSVAAAAADELCQATTAAAAVVGGAAAAVVADRTAATAQETQPVQPAVDKQRQQISAVAVAALPRRRLQTGP